MMRLFKFRLHGLMCLLLVGTFCTSHAQEQLLTDVDAVLAEILAANGGDEVIDSARSLRIHGSINSDDNSYDFMLLKKRPNRMKIAMMYKGRSIETGFDGNILWRRTTIGDRELVEKIGEGPGALEGMDVDFDGPLIGENSANTEITLEGTERIGRVEYYVLKVEIPDVRTSYHYIDSRSFREYKTVYVAEGEDGELLESNSVYSDYLRVGGIWLAQTIERTTSSGVTEVIRIKDAEVNPGIFNRFFEMPGEAASAEN